MTARQRPGGAPTPRPITYIRDIPLGRRHELCRMLDVPPAWINLAALLGFTNDDVQSFKQALYRMAGSPTDEMLTRWDYSCHTITELYRKLFEMRHARCMMLLKEFVDPSLHHLIKEVQGVQPVHDDNDSASHVYSGHPQIPPVVYVPGAGGQCPYAGKSSQGPGTTQGHQPHQQCPGQSQPTQGSWNGTTEHHASSSTNPDKLQKVSNLPGHQGGRSEGLTANINKGSSEKVIGLGSPFKDWHGESRSSSSMDNKSGNRGDLTSGGSSGMASGVSKEVGKKERLENYQDQSALSLLIHIRYEDIVHSTNNFDNTSKLGEGSFGTVYHAVINLIHYAVKRMKQNDYMGFETNKIARADQMKELRALVTYRNPYIVALCAYCFDGPSPCLVYEFMENGSLEDNLLCKAQRGPLDWRTRHRIAEGAALGINFLHKAQDQPLIHGDIKSANILLGKHMEPKIADFGLARLGPENGKTYCYLKTENAHGTLPYLPEEFKRSFKLSTKVDVFSFGVVLMEILAGERVADSRREPNKLLTDMVEEAIELEKQPQGVIERMRDRRCPDWPWDIAWYLLELALICTKSKFKQRPEIDEAVTTLRDIGATIAIRDEMQKRREEFPIQAQQQRTPEGYRDPYYTPQHRRYSPPTQEAGPRYPPPSMVSQGQGGVPMRHDWSIESNAAVNVPGQIPDPRYEASFQRQGVLSYDQGHHPYPQGYGGPRPSFQSGYRRHTSHTSEENNMVGDDKNLSSSFLSSCDMSSRMTDSLMCAPLLYHSQSSVPSSVGYHPQQSHPYSPPVYDPRQPDPRHPYTSLQYPAGYHGQTPQRYPQPQQAPSQYQNPLYSSMGGNAHPYPHQDFRYPTADANFYATQNPSVATPSESTQRRQESLTLQDHMKQLDISQLPTKPIGGPLRPEAASQPQHPASTAANGHRKEPEQNTDILPGYRPGMKEKSVKPCMVTTISEESDEDGSPLRNSLTTAEMQQFLAGKPRKPTQQTEKMMTGGMTRAMASAGTENPAGTSNSGTDKTSPIKSSLTTVQMKQFLNGKREPTEETEEESSTNRLEEALVAVSLCHQDRILTQSASSPASVASSQTPDAGPVHSDGARVKESNLQSSLTTEQMRRFLPSRREASQKEETMSGVAAEKEAGLSSSTKTELPPLSNRNPAPQMERTFPESERYHSAPSNMAAPMATPIAQTAEIPLRREPQQMTEPLNGGR